MDQQLKTQKEFNIEVVNVLKAFWKTLDKNLPKEDFRQAYDSLYSLGQAIGLDSIEGQSNEKIESLIVFAKKTREEFQELKRNTNRVTSWKKVAERWGSYAESALDIYENLGKLPEIFTPIHPDKTILLLYVGDDKPIPFSAKHRMSRYIDHKGLEESQYTYEVVVMDDAYTPEMTPG